MRARPQSKLSGQTPVEQQRKTAADPGQETGCKDVPPTSADRRLHFHRITPKLSACSRPVPPSSVLPPALRVHTRLLRPLAARSCHHRPATIISRESLSDRDHLARSCATTRAAPPLSSAPPPSFHSQWRLLHVWCRHGRRVRNAAGRACCQQTQNGDRLCLLLAL